MDMFYTLPNTEQHAALNRHSNVSYINKQFLYCYTMQTINTLTVSQAKQIHRKKRSANKLCNTNRYREQLTGHLGTHMGMWRHRQTGRQTETHNHFSTNPLTQQSFHGNHGLVNPKQRRVPEESQTNSSLRLILKFKAIKGDPVFPLSQGRLRSVQPTNLPSQICHKPKDSLLSNATKKAPTSFCFAIYCCLCVW